MRTGYNIIAKRVSIFFFIFISSTLTAQPILVNKGQEWPKLMQLFDGRVMQVVYDSIGKWHFADWQDKAIPNLTVPSDHNEAKYLYVDSTGKPLSNKLYQIASHFNGGLAVVISQTISPERIGTSEFAIINEKDEELFPMSASIKGVLDNGLALVVNGSVTAVYDRTGKEVASCTDCEVGASVGLKHFWMLKRRKNEWSEDPVVKLMDVKGGILFNGEGANIKQLVNWRNGAAFMQPYYEVTHDNSNAGSFILDHFGKVVIDSIRIWTLDAGKVCIFKNNLAAVVDTSWKFLIPFSYGYTYIVPLSGTQNGYIVYKNDKVTVVNSDNKRLVPLESDFTINYDPVQRLFEIHNRDGNYWYMSLEGDTLVNPRDFDVTQRLYQQVPGFFVKCRPGRLMGYVDEKGKLVVPCQNDNLFSASKDLFIFFANGGGGYMDTKGNVKFRVENVIRLTNFFKGYAYCLFKETDKKKFTAGRITVSDDRSSYQIHECVIDSTGRLAPIETWAYGCSDNRQFELRNGMTRGLFCDGVALLHNPKTKKYGLINEKMQAIAPAIYDSIDLRRTDYDYAVYTVDGSGQRFQWTSIVPNIVNGKVKATLKGVQKVIDVRK